MSGFRTFINRMYFEAYIRILPIDS